MEVDVGNEPLPVSITPALHLDHLDPAVETLGGTVADLQDNRIDDAPQMFPDHPGGFLHRFKTTTHRPTEPTLPRFQGPSATDVFPQRHRRLLDCPARAVFSDESRKRRKR